MKRSTPLTTWLLLVVAGVASIAAGGLAAQGSAAAETAARAAVRSDCPWSTCSPDARWLRTVLRRAGYRQVAATGSALTTPFTLNGGRQLRYYWATPGKQIDSAYKPLYRSGSVTVFGDGVRVVWRTQDAHVWIEPVPPRAAANRVVAASRAVPRR